ncbi:ribosomal RNA processing protein [Entomophthora muscae]|uniref:Ribosomal RNA processing protein n=2 Tax=Entomophthora muscae TaxID=34485 RepID=A0ACC2TIX5_9FUNG|nr:ribosomal RNA processing protein [Entomophthora muscae]
MSKKKTKSKATAAKAAEKVLSPDQKPHLEKEVIEEPKVEEGSVSDQGPESDQESASDQGPETVVTKSEADKPSDFASLGLLPSLCQACADMKFKEPTDIQKEAIPYALQGRDIIGLAQTGSGKTAAFALPILHALWEKPSGLFALVLAPTRELAIQISETFSSLGSPIGVRVAVIVGGMDMMSQSIALSKKPHIVVATPGRIQDHIENTKGFTLRTLKYLVMDEADKLLDMDFGPKIEQILKVLPKERNTYLFSATMTTKVAKLQRASLVNPVKVQVSSKYSTVDTLLQYYLFFPFKLKDSYLVYLMNELSGNSAIIFTRTCNDCQRIAMMLKNLGFPAVPLHGQLTMNKRVGALTKFKSGNLKLLVATDVAARGLDIPLVDVVINYDVPTHSKDYIHRVGRTARAGRSGKSLTLVTQYDVELLQRIENVLEKKMSEFPVDKDSVVLLSERVAEAQRLATLELKEALSNCRSNTSTNKRLAQLNAADDEPEVSRKPSKKKFRRS